MTDTQREFWKNTGRTSGDGETLPRFLPTPQARDHFPAHTPEAIAKQRAAGHGCSNLNDAAVNGASTSSRADSPVSPYLLLEPEKAPLMIDGYGMKCTEFARYSAQDGFWRKTSWGYSQQVAFEENCSERWQRTWPRSLLIVVEVGWEPIAYRLPPLVPRISGTGCSLLPTPNSTDYKGASQPMGRRPPCDDDLPSRIVREMYPTPRTEDSQCAGGHRGQDDTLYGKICKPKDKSTNKPGQLNPQFVSWMMGFPLDWCDMPEESQPESQTESTNSDASETP